MKALYNLCIILCAFQLLYWFFMPFLGIKAIILMILEQGFYLNSTTYTREYSLSEVIGIKEVYFNLLNRFVAIIYFFSLIFVIASSFFWKKKYKKYIVVICLTIISLLLWIVLPIIFGQVILWMEYCPLSSLIYWNQRIMCSCFINFSVVKICEFW